MGNGRPYYEGEKYFAVGNAGADFPWDSVGNVRIRSSSDPIQAKSRRSQLKPTGQQFRELNQAPLNANKKACPVGLESLRQEIRTWARTRETCKYKQAL